MLAHIHQVQASEARLTTEAFKATSAQALKIEAYLTFIHLEPAKKTVQTVQTVARLFSGPLYHTLTQSLSAHVKRTLTPLEILEKFYEKLAANSKDELGRKSTYIVPPSRG